MLLKLYLNGLKYRNHLIQKLKRPRIEYILALQNYPSTVIYRIQFQIILEQHEIQKAPNPKSGRHLNWISLGITQLPKYSYIENTISNYTWTAQNTKNHLIQKVKRPLKLNISWHYTDTQVQLYTESIEKIVIPWPRFREGRTNISRGTELCFQWIKLW